LKKRKRSTLDYLQFTAKDIPTWLEGESETVPPISFYRSGRKFSCSTRAFLGNAQSDKYLIQMPGRACDFHNMTECVERLEHVFETNCHFSRVDFAVTIEGHDTLLDFYKEVRAGTIVSKRFDGDAPKIISGASGHPETIYIGDLKKRGKKGVFRAYDKGLEQGLFDLLTRFELEVRKKQAHCAAKRFLTGVSIERIIRNVVDIPDAKWWADCMGDTDNRLPPVFHAPEKDEIAARWAWLCYQVGPALGKLLFIEQKAGTKNFDRFKKIVEKARQKASQDG